MHPRPTIYAAFVGENVDRQWMIITFAQWDFNICQR